MPNLLPIENELTIRACSCHHSWSFLIILAMTMTMKINLNSIFVVRVASAGWYESFEQVQKFHVMPKSHCAKSTAEHGRTQKF